MCPCPSFGNSTFCPCCGSIIHSLFHFTGLSRKHVLAKKINTGTTQSINIRFGSIPSICQHHPWISNSYLKWQSCPSDFHKGNWVIVKFLRFYRGLIVSTRSERRLKESATKQIRRLGVGPTSPESFLESIYRWDLQKFIF